MMRDQIRAKRPTYIPNHFGSVSGDSKNVLLKKK